MAIHIPIQVYKLFFEEYLKDKDESDNGYVTRMNVRTTTVTNYFFLESIQELGQFKEVNAEFTYHDVRFDKYYNARKTIYDAPAVGILTVRCDDLVMQFSIMPTEETFVAFKMTSLTPCVGDVPTAVIRDIYGVEFNQRSMVICIVEAALKANP